MPTKLSKIQKLIKYLELQARNGRTVTRSSVERKFGGDPSFVVYFNGLRRNGAVNNSGRVNVTKIKGALTTFRKQNRTKQIAHYERVGLI